MEAFCLNHQNISHINILKLPSLNIIFYFYRFKKLLWELLHYISIRVPAPLLYSW